MKKQYEKPLVEVLELKNLSFLDHFSAEGELDQFEDGGWLGEGDFLDENDV